VIRVLDQLHEAGIRIAVDDEAVRSECTRIGRQLLDGGKRIVGLLPAGERVSLPAIAIQLARALFEIDGRPVAIVDAAATWPVRVVPDRAEFTASRIIDGLVLLTPRHADPGITSQDALEFFVRVGGAVGDDHHAGVQRVADADAAAVMDRHPRRARRGVE